MKLLTAYAAEETADLVAKAFQIPAE